MTSGGFDPGLGTEAADDLMSEINVTPLVDVVLVLLLTFMVTAPLLRLAMEVEVPEVTTAAPAPAELVVLTVGAEGTVAVGDRIVTLADAIDEVLVRRRADPTGAVHVRVDRSVPYGTFASVLDALRAAGIQDVALVVEPLVVTPTSEDQAAEDQAAAEPARRRAP